MKRAALLLALLAGCVAPDYDTATIADFGPAQGPLPPGGGGVGSDGWPAVMANDNTPGAFDADMGVQRITFGTGGEGIAATTTEGQTLELTDGAGNYQALRVGSIHAEDFVGISAETLAETLIAGAVAGANDIDMGAQAITFGGAEIAAVTTLGQGLQATDGAGNYAAWHQGNTHVYEDLNVYNPTDNTDRLLVTVNASSATIQEFGAAGGMQITSNSANVLFQCAAAASYGFGLTGGRALRDLNNTTWNLLTNEFFVAAGTEINWTDDTVASSGASSRDAGISFVNSTTAFLRITDGSTGHGDLHLAHMILEGDSGIALVSSQLLTTTNGSQSDGSSSEASALRALVEVVESTSEQPAQISQTESGQLRTNRGATGVVTETLPGSPSTGCVVGFQRVATFAYRIDPEGTEEIHFAGEVAMGAGDYLEITNDYGIVWVRWDGTHWLADLGGDTTVAEQP